MLLEYIILLNKNYYFNDKQKIDKSIKGKILL